MKLANESFSFQVAVGLIHKQEADGWLVKVCRGRRSSRLMQDFEKASGVPCAPGILPTLSIAEGRNPTKRRCLFGKLMVVLLGLTLVVQPGDGSNEKSSQHRSESKA